MEPLRASAGPVTSRRTLKSRSVAESTGGQSLLSSVRTGLDLDGLKWKKPWKSVQNIKGSMPSVITAVIEQAISDTRSFDHNADIVDKKVHDTYVVFVFNGEPDLTSYKNLKSVDVADLKTNTTRSIAIIDNHDDAANDVNKIIGSIKIVTDDASTIKCSNVAAIQKEKIMPNSHSNDCVQKKKSKSYYDLLARKRSEYRKAWKMSSG